MSFQTILPWVLISGLLSVLAMVYGVSHDSSQLSLWAAGAFALFTVIIGYVINKRYWQAATLGDQQNIAAIVAARNARLIGVCYVWGAIAMLAIYTLTQLHWQHGWQYALGMVLLGMISFVFAVLLERKEESASKAILTTARILTVVQGAAALMGLLFLIGSGKMPSTGTDWAANHVFLFGGVTLVVLSIFSLRSNKYLTSA